MFSFIAFNKLCLLFDFICCLPLANNTLERDNQLKINGKKWAIHRNSKGEGNANERKRCYFSPFNWQILKRIHSVNKNAQK